MKKKLTKNTLDELAKAMPIIPEWEMRTMIGGSGALGSTENPYTIDTFESMLASGHWTSGGFVKDIGYVNAEVTITGTIPKKGLFGSYYIGPTKDAILDVRPAPAHAADYIALQHDLEYQALGLNGITGVLNSKSENADSHVIQRSKELIEYYEMGVRSYHGYPITPEAYEAAKYMKVFFEILQ